MNMQTDTFSIADPHLASALQAVKSSLSKGKLHRQVGIVSEITASRIVSTLGDVFLGEKCILKQPGSGREYFAQVVAIEDGKAILSPIAGTEGLSGATEVIGTGEAYKISVGNRLLGRVLDGLGQSISASELDTSGMDQMAVTPPRYDPLNRPVIDTVFKTGIKCIDGFNTVGNGQRMGVFGEAGAGKSIFLAMLASHSDVDVIVLAMIGERGREVNEFLERKLPKHIRERTVVVASTSDRPAMERIMAGHTAMTIAENFREKGKNVLVLFDSVTRYARAMREVGLSAGESAVRNGFTPSVYAELPKLIERAGRSEKGSITAFFTVLTENDGINDPVAEEVASLTDGHIMLNAELARSGTYPAVSILKSKSRLMNEITSEQHLASANRLRGLMAKYQDIELLVQVGEYERGSDPIADAALAQHEPLKSFLRACCRMTIFERHFGLTW